MHEISITAKHRMNAGTALNYYIWNQLPRVFMYQKAEWQPDGIDFSLQENLVQAPKVTQWLYGVVLFPNLKIHFRSYNNRVNIDSIFQRRRRS